MITVTPQPAAYSVLVELVGIAEGTTVTRDTGNGPELVRGMRGLGAGDHTLLDRECPFGVPALYAAGAETASTQLDSRLPVLSHPVLPLAVAVTIENDTPREWQTSGTVHAPLDGGAPIATYVPRRIVTGTLSIPTTDAGIAFIAQLFDDGSPLLLRTPPGCPVTDAWLFCETLSRARPIADRSLSWVSVPYTVVGAPLIVETPDPLPWTWEAVPGEWASWQLVDVPTWLDLLREPGTQLAASWGGW